MEIDERRIHSIVERVLAQLNQDSAARTTESRPQPMPVASVAGVPSGQDGIFADVDTAIAAAEVAFHALSNMTLDVRGRLIDAIRRAAKDNAEVLARAAWQETGMGRPADKMKKNLLVATNTPGVEDLQPIAWTGDRGLTLVECAPYGVIGAIIFRVDKMPLYKVDCAACLASLPLVSGLYNLSLIISR